MHLQQQWLRLGNSASVSKQCIHRIHTAQSPYSVRASAAGQAYWRKCIENSADGLYTRRFTSTVASDSEKAKDEPSETRNKSKAEEQPKKKTQAEIDKELQLKMQGLAGDGGESGIEYENGQPVSMKRSVKDNMFRYI